MVAIKGKNASVDDLIGYNKLQELLKTIIGALNDHDTSLQDIRTKHPTSLSEAVAALKKEQAAEASKVAEQFEAIRQEAAASKLAFEQLKSEAAVDRSTAEKVRKESATVATSLAGLEVRCQKLPELSTKIHKVSDLEDRLAQFEKKAVTADEIAALEKRVHDLEVLVMGDPDKADLRTTSTDSHESGMMSRALERIAAIEAKVASHDEKITETSEILTVLNADHTNLDERSKANIGALQKDLSTLRRTVVESVWGGRQTSSGQITDDAHSSFNSRLENLETEVREDLRELVANLDKKVTLGLKSLNAEMADLRQQVVLHLKHGAAATSHCLSCFANRLQTGQISPREVEHILGADGKPYLSYQRGGGFKISSSPNLATHRQAILAARGMLPLSATANPCDPQTINLQGLAQACYAGVPDHTAPKEAHAQKEPDRCQTPPGQRQRSSNSFLNRSRPSTAGSRPSSGKRRQLIPANHSDKGPVIDFTSLQVEARAVTTPSAGVSTGVPEWSQTPIQLSPVATEDPLRTFEEVYVAEDVGSVAGGNTDTEQEQVLNEPQEASAADDEA